MWFLEAFTHVKMPWSDRAHLGRRLSAGTAAAEDGLGLAEVVWEHPLSHTFSFGGDQGTWSRADRIAVEFRLPTTMATR